MTERQPDEKLIKWLGFPDPPHRIDGSRGPVSLFFARTAAIILFAVAIALPVGVFGFTSEGRGLLVDSGLAIGLGAPAPLMQVKLRECDYYQSTGRYGTSGWDCVFLLTRDGVTSEHAVELNGEEEAALQQGAGTLMAAAGLYWPTGILLSRWTDMLLLLLMSGGLFWVCYSVARRAPEAGALTQARQGRARSVDLLSRGGHAWFSFVDDEGVRRFQQSGFAFAPLHADALLTNGVALVSGQSATLLYPSLWPLRLPEAERRAILARVDETFRAGMVRKALPPQPGDPATLSGRIERIEGVLEVNSDPAVLARLYEEAWRLTWDNDDPALAARIFDARDAIAIRLGPEAAWTALRDSRARFAAPEG